MQLRWGAVDEDDWDIPVPAPSPPKASKGEKDSGGIAAAVERFHTRQPSRPDRQGDRQSVRSSSPQPHGSPPNGGVGDRPYAPVE